MRGRFWFGGKVKVTTLKYKPTGFDKKPIGLKIKPTGCKNKPIGLKENQQV